MFAILDEVRTMVKAQNGMDYLQVFQNAAGRKIFLIDNLNREMIESGAFREQDNYCTLMFAEEY